MHKTTILLLSSVALSCGGGGGGASNSEAYLDVLHSCGLLGEGSYGPANGMELNPCVLDCITNADCADLAPFVCYEGSPSAGFRACLDACQAAGPQLDCGDGTSVPESYRCDAYDDCENGIDEVDCPEIVCDGGASVFPEMYACDGYVDCDDRADEANCTGFTCGDGTVIPSAWECDFVADCEDSSDEAEGCATRTCPAP